MSGIEDKIPYQLAKLIRRNLVTIMNDLDVPYSDTEVREVHDDHGQYDSATTYTVQKPEIVTVGQESAELHVQVKEYTYYNHRTFKITVEEIK